MPRLHMPTSGSRRAVWAFPALSAYIGLCYMLMSNERAQSMAFAPAKHVFPLRVWGAIFLVVAIVMTAAFLNGRQKAYVATMCLGAGLYATWTVFFFASLADPHVSLVAPAWPMFVCVFHLFLLDTVTEQREDL